MGTGVHHSLSHVQTLNRGDVPVLERPHGHFGACQAHEVKCPSDSLDGHTY